MVFLAWQHPRVAELGRTRGDPLAGRRSTQPTSQKAKRAHEPRRTSRPNFPVIDDLGRLGSHFDCGNAGAGRLDRWWTAWRRSQTGTETNHAPGQDEKAGDLATDPSGRNQRSRSLAGGCRDFRVKLAAARRTKLGVSKRERLERQTIIDPIPPLFPCVLPGGPR